MKKLLLMLSFVFLISSVYAISDLGTFEQGKCLDLYQLCDNCTYVNLTNVNYPGSSIETFDIIMTKNGVNYNYTFCNTSLNGDYLYGVCGDKDGTFACENIEFNITPSGTQDNEVFYIVIILLAYGVSFIGFFGKNEWITIFGGLIMMFLGVYIVNTGIIIFRDVFTNAIAYVTIGLGAFFSLFTTLSIIKESYG